MLVVTTAGRPGAILDGVKASTTIVEGGPMAAVQRTAEVDWTGSIARGSGHASGGSGALGDLPITVASRFGEPEGKTSPEELIAAAHAACFTMALGSILAARRTPPEHLWVTATVTLETSGTPTIASSRLEVHGVVPGADAASFDRAAQEAERNCPVSRALQGNVEIGVQATLDEHPGSSGVGAA
ncbi:MAG TPA: OsmC family peroxiredoxin [Kribbellaceae bacterium]|nr:OsmC family peroxiredoxin [Kribbellaceae bacterium]